jgi:hypothetical protein
MNLLEFLILCGIFYLVPFRILAEMSLRYFIVRYAATPADVSAYLSKLPSPLSRFYNRPSFVESVTLKHPVRDLNRLRRERITAGVVFLVCFSFFVIGWFRLSEKMLYEYILYLAMLVLYIGGLAYAWQFGKGIQKGSV